MNFTIKFDGLCWSGKYLPFILQSVLADTEHKTLPLQEIAECVVPKAWYTTFLYYLLLYLQTSRRPLFKIDAAFFSSKKKEILFFLFVFSFIGPQSFSSIQVLLQWSCLFQLGYFSW